MAEGLGNASDLMSRAVREVAKVQQSSPEFCVGVGLGCNLRRTGLCDNGNTFICRRAIYG